MKYGVLGDIHSNLQAFQAVLEELETEKVDGYLCLGDLVGYGGDPKPVLDIVRELDPVLVAGNHDWAVAGRMSLNYFNQQARAAIHWTRGVLASEDVDWLGSHTPLTKVDDITLAHGTVHEPDCFDYLQSPYDAFLSFQVLTTETAFVGHSHIPVSFFDGNPITWTVETHIEMEGRRTISNVGSVGQPRDENPKASFGVFDSESRVLDVRRVEYDVEAASARIIEVGLPPILGDRLHVGR